MIQAVVPLCKGILQSLDREVKAPFLAVHRDVGIAVQRGRHAGSGENLVRKIFLHPGGVALYIIDDKFVQALAGLTIDIMVKFKFKAEPIAVRGCDRRQAGIALGAHADMVIRRAVYRQIAGDVFLGQSVVEHLLPVLLVDGKIDLHHGKRIKQIAIGAFSFRRRAYANRLRTSGENGDEKDRGSHGGSRKPSEIP